VSRRRTVTHVLKVDPTQAECAVLWRSNLCVNVTVVNVQNRRVCVCYVYHYQGIAAILTVSQMFGRGIP